MKGSSCGMKKPKAMKKGGMAKMAMPMAKMGATPKKGGSKKGGVSNMMLGKMGRNMAKKAV